MQVSFSGQGFQVSNQGMLGQPIINLYHTPVGSTQSTETLEYNAQLINTLESKSVDSFQSDSEQEHFGRKQQQCVC